MSELASITDGVVPGGFLAAIDNIWVMLAIVVISAISSWLQKRNEKNNQPEPWGGEDDETYRQQQQQRSGGSPSAPNPNQPLNWEEELKRLLEGKPPLDGTAGTPPPPPPPVIRREVPPPLPKTVARESEGIDEESLPSRESSSPWQDTSLDSQPAPTKPLAHLEQTTQAYHRATQLHETVAAHLRRVDEQTEKHGKPLAAPRPIRRDAGSADARAVVALLRRPSTARQALIASFVLAPPKALES